MSENREQNPARYARLSEPMPDAEAADEAARRFGEGVKALREECGIPDVVVAFAGRYMHNGEPVEYVSGADWGDPLKAEGIAAWMYGRCQSQRKEIVNRMLTQGGKL